MESTIGSDSDFTTYSLFRSIGSEPRHLWSHPKSNQQTIGKTDTDLDQLFVFGYSCKLFRDDRKAQELDAGHHLIGWNGSSDHLIDRFDVRGYLNDLTQFQTNHKSYGSELTEEELEIERLCDAERFADLKYDDLDDTHDEELKRLHLALADGSGYNQMGYNYDENNVIPKSPESIPTDQTVETEETDSFKLPTGLSPPEHIVLPESQKHHNIIEKTASFVSQHGIQMEIILKTKQSSNKNFDFLSFDSELYPYYKFILENIKSGKYVPKDTQNSDNSSDSGQDSDDEHYLHPSLLGSGKTRESNTFKIPSLLRTATTDDTYSQLVKSFKDRFPVTEEEVPIKKQESVGQQMPKQLTVDTEVIKTQISHKDKSLVANVTQNSWSSLLPSPPPEIEQIIEKLAQRVAQNGEQFELSIRKLGETRFEFVNPGHIYHAHYIRRKLHYLEENRSAQAAHLKLINKKHSKVETNAKIAVSFSINSKDSKPPIGPTDENLLIAGSSKREDDRNFNPELMAKRMSENALKDKLALAVRDRAAKEKQEERKRKAAVFLSLLKNKSKETKKTVDSNQSLSEKLSNFGTELSKLNPKTESAPLSPTIAAITSPNASPEAKQNSKDSSALEIIGTNKSLESGAKSGSLLPFIVSDKPLKASSSSTSRHSSPHRHHKSRRSSDHKKSHKRRRSRSKSRSRSSSRSPSRSHRKHSKRLSKSRSRSRSRSHSRTHRRR